MTTRVTKTLAIALGLLILVADGLSSLGRCS